MLKQCITARAALAELKQADASTRETLQYGTALLEGFRYLKQLVDIGVLRELEFGREKLFIHPKMMQLLTRDDNGVTPYPSVAQ